MAKPGFDGHWRGAVTVSMALRDAGMEVIYAGNQSPSQIVETAIQEDVEVVGLSILAASHMKLITQVVYLLKQKGIGGRLLVVGGTIPREDIPTLKRAGVDEVFLPGSPLDSIVGYIRGEVERRRGQNQT
jgi:methylmalonyl-CoA mutase C-terminal domain/subunit